MLVPWDLEFMSLTTRALIAILLMIGFYVLALSIAGFLIWIPYTQWNDGNQINPKLVFFCLASAGVILWSILPRPDRFEVPGPQIEAEKEPVLFAELSNIARNLGQELPHEIYLVPDVNAGVLQRGGVMGFGSRRVMVLGLPLMALLTISQFRAVLAHEFGHYYGGDTKLGPWIYKTRSAIGRTLLELRRRNSFLVFLFQWYGVFFLEITLGISRAQEYAADRLGAQVAGSKAMIDGLKQIHRGSVVWQGYFRSEVAPILANGYSPPLAAGFVRFLESPSIQGAVDENLQKELAEGKADSLDSHPALNERIAAIQTLPDVQDIDPRPATELLANFESCDTSLLTVTGAALKPVKWEQVLDQVLTPIWARDTQYQKEALRGLTVASLSEQFSSGALARKIKNPHGVRADLPQRVDIARVVAGCALCLALLRDGWRFYTLPGQMYCEKNEHRLEPFQIVVALDRRQITADQWKDFCTRTGIINLSLEPDAAVHAANG